MRLLMRVVAGAISGCVATLPMTAVMLLLGRGAGFGERSALAPAQIVRNLRLKLGLETRDAQTPASILAHLGYGSLLGVVYALVVGGRRAPKLTGVAFALVAWAVSYLGWLPVVGLFPRATRDARSRQLRILAAHAVWGETLQLTHLLLRKATERGSSRS